MTKAEIDARLAMDNERLKALCNCPPFSRSTHRLGVGIYQHPFTCPACEVRPKCSKCKGAHPRQLCNVLVCEVCNSQGHLPGQAHKCQGHHCCLDEAARSAADVSDEDVARRRNGARNRRGGGGGGGGRSGRGH